MVDLVGHEIGQYQVQDEIAKGGMATVYRAYQPSMNRDVAIKILPSSFSHDASFEERFYREVSIIASLQHPHILPVYDFGTYNNMPFIAMAYLSGGTLSDWMKEESLSVDEVIRVIRQIADALDFAHSKGILHRDFKPANVLLDERGNTYLADFGLAKVTQERSEITGGAILGTPTYMAPEQAGPDELTQSIDIYALGVTLYQLLTGQAPFQASTAPGILMAHVTQPVPDIRELRPDLPQHIQQVIEKSLAKEVPDRYQTAGKMAQGLVSALEGKSSASSTADTASDRFTALLMTNMLGHVIFVDNQALRVLKRHHHEARNIIGTPLHDVLGIDPSLSTQMINAISTEGGVEKTMIEIIDSQGESRQVFCSALATTDDDGNFVGADITLEVVPDATSPLADISGEVSKPINTMEENSLENYFKAQIEMLHQLVVQWGGGRMGRNLEDVVNETGRRNVWAVNMQDGEITVQLSRKDTDIYRAVLARSMTYAASLIGEKLVIKALQRLDANTHPDVLNFVDKLGLARMYEVLLD